MFRTVSTAQRNYEPFNELHHMGVSINSAVVIRLISDKYLDVQPGGGIASKKTFMKDCITSVMDNKGQRDTVVLYENLPNHKKTKGELASLIENLVLPGNYMK